MSMLAADSDVNYGPKRMNTSVQKQATIAFGNGDYTDYLYLSADEDANDSYEIGKDLAKMSMTAEPTVAQIMGVAYGTNLCMVNAPLSNNQATYAISLYAPTNGTYHISAEDITDANVYLTKDGVVMQDITSQAVQLELSKGENNQYGLILSAEAPATTTNIDNIMGTETIAQKIIVNNQLFILRDKKLYDITGKMIRK